MSLSFMLGVMSERAYAPLGLYDLTPTGEIRGQRKLKRRNCDCLLGVSVRNSWHLKQSGRLPCPSPLKTKMHENQVERLDQSTLWKGPKASQNQRTIHVDVCMYLVSIQGPSLAYMERCPSPVPAGICFCPSWRYLQKARQHIENA